MLTSRNANQALVRMEGRVETWSTLLNVTVTTLENITTLETCVSSHCAR